MAKVPVGIRVDEELMERLRNAIWYTGHGLTVTSVVEEAIETAVAALEKHNGGRPFGARHSQIAKSPLAARNHQA